MTVGEACRIMTPLDSIQCKIFRAAQHIQFLHTELHRYFQSNPGIMVAQPDTTDDEAYFGFRCEAGLLGQVAAARPAAAT